MGATECGGKRVGRGGTSTERHFLLSKPSQARHPAIFPRRPLPRLRSPTPSNAHPRGPGGGRAEPARAPAWPDAAAALSRGHPCPAAPRRHDGFEKRCLLRSPRRAGCEVGNPGGAQTLRRERGGQQEPPSPAAHGARRSASGYPPRREGEGRRSRVPRGGGGGRALTLLCCGPQPPARSLLTENRK